MEAERRRAARIPCRVSLNLLGRLDGAPVVVVDLSRTGLRIRVRLEDLGLETEADLEAIWTATCRVFAGTPTADLAPETLGSLIRRRVKPVRLVPPQAGATAVEIGCAFEESLLVEEAAALGLALPA
ncbi:MAG: PilZ domain-containing protein [Planctomycetota bacterium]